MKELDLSAEGEELYQIISDLYPICRSITGNGLRQTLGYFQKYIPLTLHEVPTGTKVFDWEIPKEWNIRDAWIKGANGERIVDFQKSNLHVVSYSVPVRQKLRIVELQSHLHSLPEHPDWIPYRTSYYTETWGFCLSHHQREQLREEEEYDVCIDSTLEPGHLTFGEYCLQGALKDEVLISCHVCHPSLCNDNLSGMSVALKLAKHLTSMPLRWSYRFLWIPGTIGAVTWLALNEKIIPNIKHGLVLSCLGDPGCFTYKRSRHGNAFIDRAVEHVLGHAGREAIITNFSPSGYDERQYCSPGINLPLGCLMRTPNGQYPEYHTSADGLNLVNSASLSDSLQMLLFIVEALESNRRYLNLNPKCEPQLSRRGLYRQLGGFPETLLAEQAILWMLNLSDGKHALLDIAERSSLGIRGLSEAAEILCNHSLLRVLD